MKRMKGIEKKKIIQIQYTYNAVFLGGCYEKEKKGQNRCRLQVMIGHSCDKDKDKMV